MNIDANKTFGLPIKKQNEEYGVVTQHIRAVHQKILEVNGKPANSESLKISNNRNFDYSTKRWDVYWPIGYQVLWIPSTGVITYIFSTDEINLPINLKEIYNY
jgi:hypothetical protein